jgi:hypothetical protein
MRISTILAVFLLLGTLLLGACASGRSSNDPFRGGGGPASLKVHVTNLNFNDARLHAFVFGTRKMLGTVSGKRETTFTIPWERPSDLRIEIDLLAGDRCTTRPISVNPGDQVELVIDQRLLNSPLCRGRD